MDLREEKALLRQRIQERLQQMDAKQRAAEGRSVCRRILEHLPTAPCSICAYVPLITEVDVRPMLEEILKRGNALYLPRFEGKLTFRRAEHLKDLKPGALKIPEPPEDAEELDPKMLDIALIPGRAFDRQGHRLGRGNGGYDVWITEQRKANPKTLFWGIAFEMQIVDRVPTEAHDAAVDEILTARGKG